MRNAWALLASLLVVVAAPADAAINGPRPFFASFDYDDGLGGESLRIVSGDLRATMSAASGTYGFFNTTGAAVTGLRQACWGPGQCTQSGAETVAVVVQDGGSFGLALPDTSDARVEAVHALGIFADFGGEDDLNSLTLGRSLVAPLLDGEVAFTRITPIASSGPVLLPENAGGLSLLDEGTVVSIYRGDTLITTRTGKVDAILFTGGPAIEPFATDFAILPFGGASHAFFTPASKGAAKEGLDLGRIQDLSQRLQEAQADEGSPNRNEGDLDLGGFDDLLAEVLNGAILGVPNGQNSFSQSFVLVRFTRLGVESDGEGLGWSGTASLQMVDGQVAGAKPLYGLGVLSLPWWGYVLWVAAIAALVVRIATDAPTKNERWDDLRWVGWIAGPVAFAIVFVLWDLEMKAVWGTSVFSTASGGKAFWVTALVQVLTLSLVLFAAAAPLRLLMRNGLILGRQGTFMNLSGAAATLVGYLIGAHLLLSYLELILAQVIEALG